MNWSGVTFNPPVAPEYIWAAAALLIGLALLNYTRPLGAAGRFKRLILAVLRIGALVGIALVLLRPMRDVSQATEGDKPVFMVLMDGTQSMNTTDMDGESRVEAIREHLRENERVFRDELESYYNVEYYTFDSALRATSMDRLLETTRNDGNQTDLAGSLLGLASTVGDRNAGGALLISDGRDNVGGEITSAASFLGSLDIPVWTTNVGTTEQTKDLHVTARFAQNFIFREREATLSVSLNHTGYKGWYAMVNVLREGEPIGTEQVRLESAVQHIRIPVTESERGTIKYTVRVDPLAGEADPGNNERTVFIQVVDEKAKVLFIEAEPYWDSKFLLRSLQADPNLEVTAIFQTSPRRDKVFAVTDSAARAGPIRMPHTKDELFRYDCVIIGRGADAVFNADQMRLIKDYLEERGGGVIFARGKSYKGRSEILAELEPVVWDEGGLARVRFELTPAGGANPIFDFGENRSSDLIIRELPEMLSVSRVEGAKSLAIVLAKTEDTGTGSELATIAYQRYGKGKVMSVGATGLWRWAFMREELSHYDEVYARFWAQMIRWLVYGSDFLPGQDIAFHTDRMAYSPNESVSLVVQTKLIDPEQYRPRIVVTGPGGQRTELKPALEGEGTSLYSALFTPDREGEYSATLRNNIGAPETDTVGFTVYSDAIETRVVSANPELLRHIAAITGARAVTPDEWSKLPSEARTRALNTRKKSKPIDIWDTYTILGLLVGLLGMEWLIRRRAGLL